MFRFANKGVVLWPVTLRQVDADGIAEDVTVFIGYQLLQRKELRGRELAALKRMGAKAIADAATIDELVEIAEAASERETGDTELLLDRVTTWRGFADGDDNLEYTRERLAALIEYDVYYKPIMAGLHEASRHGPSKNSQPGPGGVPALVQA